MVLLKLLARSERLDKTAVVSSSQAMIVRSVSVFLSGRYPPARKVHHRHPEFT